MPPPHFSTNIGGSSQQPAQSSSHPSVSDLPKSLRSYSKDALQNIQTALTTEDEVIAQSTSVKAFQSIQKLVDSTDLHYNVENDTNKGSFPRNRVTSSEGPGAATGTNGEGSQVSIGKLVSTVIDAALFDFFNDHMDQYSHSKRLLLIYFLHALRPVLDPRCVVLEWWDVLLRPMLKNPNCKVVASRKAQQLVIWAMTATPSSAYVDEPSPTAVWPRPDQSATVAAASPRTGRKSGDAPYPASSTRSISQSRSSEDGEARFSALFSTPSKKTGLSDPLRRFTQRIFDLYTSEASSASLKIAEDDEIREIEESDEEGEDGGGIDSIQASPSPSPSPGSKGNNGAVAGVDLDQVGPTWKGNLEAIILTFGEERPKPFFHHLSESFLDPQSRIPILLLLTIFFRLSSLHAYYVVATPFVRLLVLSLQLDTSKTSTSLGVLALVTLIPHCPNWLASGGAGGIPALLSIFARIVDWKKLIPGWEERTSSSTGPEAEEEHEWQQVERLSKRLQLRKGLEWKRLESNYDAAQTQRPNAEMLFTVLYGIFPCNVIRFLRAPIDYLRKAEYQSPFLADWDDIIDENAIQQKSAPILRHHILHPALVEMDAEREISDTQRWKDHDTASTTADCASLYVGNAEASVSSWNLLASYNVHTRFMQPRSASGSSFGADPTLAATLFAGDQLGRRIDTSDETLGTQGKPRPFRIRQRSASESRGRIGKNLLQANFINNTLVPQRRETSVHFSPELNDGEGSVFTSPRLPSTLDRRGYQDDTLRNHVALRSGIPLSKMRSNSGIDTPSRAGPSRSFSSGLVRSFNAPQPTLTSTVMSPSRSTGPSSGLTHSVNASISGPPSPAIELVQGSKDDVGSLSLTMSPLANGEREILGSPAISLGSSPIVTKRDKLAYLQQENMQLRNELNYEIGQKDQLLQHIGTIHRNRVKDTVLEEELQNLYHLVKSQKFQIKTLKDDLEKSKGEAQSSKSRQKKWEADIFAKSKLLREEKKACGNEIRTLKIAKEDREELIEKLERQVDENAGELFELREKVKSDAKKVKAIREYEEKIKRLETCLRIWNEDMQVFEKQNGDMRRLLSRWEEMSMLVEAGEVELNAAKGRVGSLEREKDTWQRRAEEANQVIAQLAKRKDASKTLERLSSPALSASKGREEAEKMKMKKRIEELEVQLLDAKVREEQWQMSARSQKLQQEQQQPQARRDSHVSILPSEQDIAPLQLGEAIQD